MLEFINVTHKYEKNNVIDNFSMTIESNLVTSLLGSSGSGKTTLLRLATGLEKIQHGEIIFNGFIDSNNNGKLNTETRNIGYVFQDCALFPHLNVEENIFYGLNNYNKKIIDKINILLKNNNFLHYKKRYPHELSGGQKQLVAVFRALASDPKLIIMDEPFSNLDTRLKEELRDQILHIIKENQVTTLLVTHDADEAMFMSDKIGILNNGKLEQFGTPIEIYTRPKSKFVANFFGDINVFHGLFKNGKFKTILGEFKHKKNSYQKEYFLIVRSEGLKLLNLNGKHNNNLFEIDKKNLVKCPNIGKIIESKFLGANTIVHLSLTNEKEKYHLHVKIPGINFFKANEMVNIFTDLNYTYIFNT